MPYALLGALPSKQSPCWNNKECAAQSFPHRGHACKNPGKWIVQILPSKPGEIKLALQQSWEDFSKVPFLITSGQLSWNYFLSPGQKHTVIPTQSVPYPPPLDTESQMLSASCHERLYFSPVFPQEKMMLPPVSA